MYHRMILTTVICFQFCITVTINDSHANESYCKASVTPLSSDTVHRDAGASRPGEKYYKIVSKGGSEKFDVKLTSTATSAGPKTNWTISKNNKRVAQFVSDFSIDDATDKFQVSTPKVSLSYTDSDTLSLIIEAERVSHIDETFSVPGIHDEFSAYRLNLFRVVDLHALNGRRLAPTADLKKLLLAGALFERADNGYMIRVNDPRFITDELYSVWLENRKHWSSLIPSEQKERIKKFHIAFNQNEKKLAFAHGNVMSELLSKGIDPFISYPFETIFYKVAKSKDTALLDFFLQGIRDNVYSAEQIKVANSDARRLIHTKANSAKKIISTLYQADMLNSEYFAESIDIIREINDPELVRMIACVAVPSYDPDTSELYRSALYTALSIADVQVLDLFIQRYKKKKGGVEQEHLNELLKASIKLSELEVIQYLLMEGADPNDLHSSTPVCGNCGRPLDVAVFVGAKQDVIDELIMFGADVNLSTSPETQNYFSKR